MKYYQTNTNNKSFIEVYKILTTQGVKNNKFMLELLNPDLKDIDPWDQNLTLEEKGLVLKECKGNFWYFLREVLRWPHGTWKKRYP